MKTDRFRMTAVVMMCAVLALAAAHPASAFIRIARQADASSPVVQAHWLPGDLPLNMVIAPANLDKTDAVASAEIVASAEEWELIPTSYFSVDAHDYTGAVGELVPALAFDGQNSILFDPTGANFPTAGVIAFTRSIIDGATGQTLDADVVANDRDFWWSTSAVLEPAPAGQSSVDLRAVITHELGHAFGLDHTSVLGCTMIPFIQNNISQRTLELDDQAGNSTIYPEASFLSDFGTISGSITNGFSGAAVFGGHVEAYDLAFGGDPAHSISAISGELTLRNGTGEYQIHGLPPGNYAVRVVPLDGVHTTAADANVGGPYNGLDIDFETEFYNGAGESADGFADPPNDFTPISVTAGADTPGINIQTNAYAGRVEIAQYGQFENVVTFRSTGYLAVRFDPPFDGPYTIQQIEFPSFTFNGVPAPFLSAKLCLLDQTTGLPDIANPIINITPFNGNPNGVNTIPVNLAGINGATYFWALQFPSQAIPGFPNNFPFLRADLVQLERGIFANSYTLPVTGTAGAGVLVDRNITVSMRCQLTNASDTPIKASSNLGGNRKATQMEFTYTLPQDVREDKFALPAHSLDHIELIVRPAGAPGTYSDVASGGAGTSSIKLSPNPTGVGIYSTQAVDKFGHRSLQSSVTIPGIGEDALEPNGARQNANVLSPPVVNQPATYGPAGDQDFYSVSAKAGETITASATHVGALDGRNDPDYVMFLLDQSGAIVAFNDDFTGLDPKIVYTVPPMNGKGARTFTIQVTDFYGSLLAPTAAPRVPTPATYRLDASVAPAVNAAMAMRNFDPDHFMFANTGPNPANPLSKFSYVIPRNAGAQDVKFRIFDVNGRLVRTLVTGVQSPGPYTAVWDGRDDNGRGVASGNYFARLNVGGSYRDDSRVTILK